MGFLEVPGARLYYETRGSGPPLFMIGSPMDSTGFAPLAEIMAATHSVVTYDPRGIGTSTREDAEEDITPELQADDVHRFIGALGGGPVDYLGSSGGAVVGLALVQVRPDVLRTLVAHEPPVIEELPDSREQRAAIQAIYDAYMTDGWQPAMQMFMTHIGVAGGGDGGAPQWEPTPEQLARMEETNKVFFGHLIRQTTGFRPDVEALKAAQTRIVVGVGATSKGQLAHRTGLALARSSASIRSCSPATTAASWANPASSPKRCKRFCASVDAAGAELRPGAPPAGRCLVPPLAAGCQAGGGSPGGQRTDL